jgi:hypothetical protein
MGDAMRGVIRLIVGTVIIFAGSPASAQRYDPGYPVCMEIADGEGSRTECFFTSMEQCKEGAKGMPGSCFNNPYYKPSRLLQRTWRPSRLPHSRQPG